jgi:hypothetical protein
LFGMCVPCDGCSGIVFCVADVPCECSTFGSTHSSSLASASAWLSGCSMQLASVSV